MAVRDTKTGERAKKVSDSELIGSYREMKSRDMTKEEAISHLIFEYCPSDLDPDSDEAKKFGEKLYGKIFKNHSDESLKKNPGNANQLGIIPAAIKTRDRLNPLVTMAAAITSLSYQDIVARKDEPNIAKFLENVDGTAKKTGKNPEAAWSQIVENLEARKKQIEPRLKLATQICQACEVSNDGVYWTPGRKVNVNPISSLLKENVAGVSLDSLMGLFNNLS